MTELHSLPPTEQVYQSFVPTRYDGFPIEKYFSNRFAYHSESEWARRIRDGKITVNGKTVQPGYVVRDQDRIVTRSGPHVEPPANRSLKIIFENRQVRVFNKAAPIPVHPSGRFFRNSMTELLKEIYPDEVPRPVQRLDLTTTGVIVFARSRQAATFIMNQFQENRVYKEYLALVEGVPEKKSFVIETPIGKLRGSRRGTGSNLIKPKPARTEVHWLSSQNGRSLLKVIPRSGRTNQIRVHLASAGLPVFNDDVYGNGREAGSLPQFGLHALRLRVQCLNMELDLTAACPDHFHPFLNAAINNPV